VGVALEIPLVTNDSLLLIIRKFQCKFVTMEIQKGNTKGSTKRAKDFFDVSFYLGRPDKTGRFQVFVGSKQNTDMTIRMFTDVKVYEHEWKYAKKGSTKGMLKAPSSDRTSLEQLKVRLENAYSDLCEQGQVPNLRDIWNHAPENIPSDDKILPWIEKYLKSKGAKTKPVTSMKFHLEKFNRNLVFQKLNNRTMKDFLDKMIENGLSNNTAYKMLLALQIVCRYAVTYNIHVRPEVFDYKMPYSTKNGSVARLTWAEVKAVMDVDVVGMEALAKDVFLIACFTGLRISDILTIHEATLGNFHLELQQEKTNEPVLITLHKYNEALVRKYHPTGIKYTRQILSDHLDKVLQKAITGDFIIRRSKGNEIKKDTVEKWKAIAFHSGRRFYARLLNDLGLGMEIARDELGHSHGSVTEIYAGSPDHAQRVARVRQAVGKLEKTMKQLALMKVA
jgi:integrase